jgi:[NiFe] hydrogenase assembly HybE family chaperone
MSDQVTEDRITKLVQRFTHIGDTGMRDLPIYNHNLVVEAVGFQPMENGWLGVLITPWFINVIFLPEHKTSASKPLGEKLSHELASGIHEFSVGEDDELGYYDFITLASPTLKYKSQQAARAAAEKALYKLMTPPEEYQEQIPEQPVQFVAPEQKGKQRRKFLRGLLGKDATSDSAD